MGDTRASDQQVMAALHDTHAATLWHFVRRLVHDRGRAEDVVQETLIRAWRHPEVLARGPDATRAWLFTVARRLVIDDWRSARWKRELTTDEPPERAAPDDVDAWLQSWVVADAVRRLSDEHRAVLIECYYRGRSTAEAAAALHIPQGTVKSRTHYALKALRLTLQEMGIA